MKTKELFYELLHEKGYASLYDFCSRANIDYGNMNKRVNGIRQKIEIAYAFKLANILKVPIERIISIFYPTEYSENMSIVNEEG